VTRPIELEAAERRFGNGRTQVIALHPTTLGVERGELLAIMGPSGSGKTTLLSLVGGLDRATGGRVLVEGKDIGQMSPSQLALLRRRTVGYVFQDLNLLAGLTARENVSLPLELDGARVAAAQALAAQALQSVGLGHLADRYPDDLSGGEQQRVAIARALVGGRGIVLADEPTGALDSVGGKEVIELLSRLHIAGQTIILVTHDANVANAADTVLLMRDGRIVSDDGAGDADGDSMTTIGSL